MAWIFAIPLWYTFDDHLAEALGAPGVGDMRWWVVLLACMMLHWVTTAELEEKVRELAKRSKKKG